MSRSSWADIEESSSVLGIKFLFWVYRLLGRWVFTVFLAPVIGYFFCVKGHARRASKDYLARLKARGQLPADGSLTWLSVRHFMHFGANLLDKLAVWAGTLSVKGTCYEGGGRENFIKDCQAGQGAVVITSHLGNLEASRVVADSHRRVKLNILVHTKHAQKFNKILHELDEESSLNLMQVSDVSPATAIALNDKINAGEALVIAGDRTPVAGGQRQTAVNFLGSEALFPQGPYLLASILKCPVYLLFCVRHGKGFKIVLEPFADRIQLSRANRDAEIREWARRYVARLEDYVVQYPLQWFNFYDFWQSRDRHCQ